MGSGTWSAKSYNQRMSSLRASGKDVFAYSKTTANVHPSLDPHGLKMRESRDNPEHPESNAIVVGLDVSGSMDVVVRGIHKDLPQLLGLLLDRKYVPNPQIMFAAFDNGTCDKVPLQVGQFESDNRMDQNLENMILGGGCDERESSELIIYTAARHTVTDCWEKRRHKGFLFVITDEMAYNAVKHNEINRIIGSHLWRDIPLEKIIAEAAERYNVFVIIPMQTMMGKSPKVHEFWKHHVGAQNVIPLENADDVSEVIALTIGLTEGTIGLDDGISDLRAIGTNDATLQAVTKALAAVPVKGSGAHLGDSTGDDKRTRRL